MKHRAEWKTASSCYSVMNSMRGQGTNTVNAVMMADRTAKCKGIASTFQTPPCPPHSYSVRLIDCPPRVSVSSDCPEVQSPEERGSELIKMLMLSFELASEQSA